jgi:hypothetical protein
LLNEAYYADPLSAGSYNLVLITLLFQDVN